MASMSRRRVTSRTCCAAFLHISCIKTCFSYLDTGHNFKAITIFFLYTKNRNAFVIYSRHMYDVFVRKGGDLLIYIISYLSCCVSNDQYPARSWRRVFLSSSLNAIIRDNHEYSSAELRSGRADYKKKKHVRARRGGHYYFSRSVLPSPVPPSL